MKGMVLPKGWRVTVPTHKTMAMLLTPPAPSTSTCHHFWPHKVNWKCVTILISIFLGNECLHYHVNYTSSVIITINLQGLYQWHTKKRALCHAPLPPPPPQLYQNCFEGAVIFEYHHTIMHWFSIMHWLLATSTLPKLQKLKRTWQTIWGFWDGPWVCHLSGAEISTVGGGGWRSFKKLTVWKTQSMGEFFASGGL